MKRGRNGACGASPKPLVPGVPAVVSDGGAGGLPDLPREARGRGVVSETRGEDVSEVGLRGMGGIWRSPRPRSRCPNLLSDRLLQPILLGWS